MSLCILVDDNKDNQAVAGALCSTMEVSFLGVTDPARLLQVVDSHKPAVLLLNLDMAALSTREVLAQLRKAGHGFPILVLIGDELSREARRDLIAMGANGVILKRNSIAGMADAILDAKMG